MLFATIGDAIAYVCLFMCFFLFAAGRAVKMISGSSVGRSATKKGASYLIRQLFK